MARYLAFKDIKVGQQIAAMTLCNRPLFGTLKYDVLTSMDLTALIFTLLALASVAWYFAQGRANAFRRTTQLHSLPRYHGAYVALWCALPALIILLMWSVLESIVLDNMLIEKIEAQYGALDLDLKLNQIQLLDTSAKISRAEPQTQELANYYYNLKSSSRLYKSILVIILAVGGSLFALSFSKAQSQVRNKVERTIRAILMIASSIAILTTVGIVMSVLFESIRFFQSVPITEFLFGTHWSPQTSIREDQVGSSSSFGAVPLLAGTFLISLIALVVAVPLGLMSAIYLSEYASKTMRAISKPGLEVLAGIPTVVYGFFAALTVGPFIRNLGESIGLSASSESALVAGLVMGVMIIPFVSSLSDDVLNAVPQNLRDGSYALGSTRSETILQVVIPAALPGIVGSIILAASRAIGETMIVVMAAGLAAKLTANPLEAVTTVTVQIVTLLTGDQEFDSPKTLAAFALGLILFVITLLLNMLALHIVRRYREQYE